MDLSEDVCLAGLPGCRDTVRAVAHPVDAAVEKEHDGREAEAAFRELPFHGLGVFADHGRVDLDPRLRAAVGWNLVQRYRAGLRGCRAGRCNAHGSSPRVTDARDECLNLIAFYQAKGRYRQVRCWRTLAERGAKQ